MNTIDDPAVKALVLAARSAALRLDADIFSIKQSFRAGDGRGGLKPFCRRRLAADDRRWIEQEERRFDALNVALSAFDAAIPNPASS